MNTPYIPPSSESQPGVEKIPNYLVWAILCTVCCCLPGGIVSIVYATKVDSLAAAGDIAGARDASNKAKLWAMISGGVGLVFGILYTVLMIIGVMTSP